MSDPERIIREVSENPPRVVLTPWQKLGRAVGSVLGLAALVIALTVFVEQHATASCAYQDARAQYLFTQAIERLFLPPNATPAEHKAAAARFHRSLDRYATSATEYQNCVR